MLKNLLYISAATILLNPVASHALEADVTASTTTLQVPCRAPGVSGYNACIVSDVTFEASAPRNDVVFYKRLINRLPKNAQRVAIVHRYHISSRYYNPTSVINVWDENNNFIAQYEASRVRSSVIYYTSDNGGRTWSRGKSTTPGVFFTITF